MVMPSGLTRAAIEAIEAAPCSLRALARAAGVSHVLLIKIRDGQLRATEEVAIAIAEALDGWAEMCTGGAEGLRQALTKGGADER